MDRAAKDLAEQMLLIHGERTTTEDRDLIAEVLEDRGLDCEPGDIDDFIRYARWLWDE